MMILCILFSSTAGPISPGTLSLWTFLIPLNWLVPVGTMWYHSILSCAFALSIFVGKLSTTYTRIRKQSACNFNWHRGGPSQINQSSRCIGTHCLRIWSEVDNAVYDGNDDINLVAFSECTCHCRKLGRFNESKGVDFKFQHSSPALIQFGRLEFWTQVAPKFEGQPWNVCHLEPNYHPNFLTNLKILLS